MSGATNGGPGRVGDGDGDGVAADLRRAIEGGELRLHYQPVVCLGADRARGVEALVRWQHPERGLLGPGEFIPLAEDTGLIAPLGAWVVEEACRQGARWRQTIEPAPSLQVSVNVSPRQIDSDLVDVVAGALAASGLDAAHLVLEVTESVLTADLDAVVGTLRSLKDVIGVSVSIDDFGTGYSSLTHLRRFPVDELKVDRSFVAGLGHDREDTAIVSAMVAMAHALELEVVAEGVETGDQMARLRALGCDHVQGFHFSPPRPSEQVAPLLPEPVSAWAALVASDGPGRCPPTPAPSDVVVLADDAPDVLQLAGLSLRAAGFQVHQASNGREALALVRALRPDCVVLDVSMPDLDGFEVCRALRNDPVTTDCTIVMLTAKATAEDKVTAFSLGADDYMVKPFAPRDIVSRVRAALSRRRAG